MGWLGTLAQVFGSGAGQYGDYVKVAGDVAAGIAKGRAQGRVDESAANANTDRNAIARYVAEQNAKEAAALLTENATKDRADRTLTDARDRAKQVMQGDLMANLQQSHLEGLPSYIPRMSFSGGAINAMGPATRQAGRNLAQQALQAQMSGSDIPGLPNTSGIGTNAPALTPNPSSGILDTILTGVGAAGGIAGGLEEARTARAKAQAEQDKAAGVDTMNTPQAPTVETMGGTTPQGIASSMPSGNRGTSILAALLELKRRQDAANQQATILSGTDQGSGEGTY